MYILGAGLAGLLAGNMLRRFNPVIYEGQSSLPNNHAALLRFRTDNVAAATAIPFKKVKVNKAIVFNGRIQTQPNIQLENLYSLKVTGELHSRSIGNLEPVERYIAPRDFISQAATQLRIEYGRVLSKDTFEDFMKEHGGKPIISTIPMNIMMEITGYPKRYDVQFKHLPIWSVTADIKKIKSNIYQTIYYPGKETAHYRASITGDHVICELLKEPNTDNIDLAMRYALIDFGIGEVEISKPEIKFQKYGKLLPIDESIRKEFMAWLTDKFGIYSVGRFATWRQILMDDVVKDIGIIEKFIASDSAKYDRRKQLNI